MIRYFFYRFSVNISIIYMLLTALIVIFSASSPDDAVRLFMLFFPQCILLLILIPLTLLNYKIFAYAIIIVMAIGPLYTIFMVHVILANTSK